MTYIRDQKYPYIYTISISIGKNQSAKVHGALYILTYDYNYKVIKGCDIILKEYYMTDRHKCENTKRHTIMSSTKDAYEMQKKNTGDERGGWNDRAPDGLPKIHASSAHL